ncbi:hypothetical protein V1279_005009 [Bradyrhizobium sp. AZCC 1610]
MGGAQQYPIYTAYDDDDGFAALYPISRSLLRYSFDKSISGS